MVPWVTLALVALNVGLFCCPLQPPGGSCLSVQAVWDRGQWHRLLLAPFHHLSACHLAMNMATLFWLGRGLEEEVGSVRTGTVLLLLALLGGLLHLALNAMLTAVTGRRWYWEHCAVGFSGVLFALEALGRQVEPPLPPGAALAGGGIGIGIGGIGGGMALTPRGLCVLECLLLALLHPRSSLTGHVSGILAGLAFSASPLSPGG